MQTIHVVGAAIMDGDKILAAQRSPAMKPPLKWEFVGGKVEENETHEQALEREVYEELGIRVEVGKYVATGSSVMDGREIILHVYEARILEGTPSAREHSRLEWIDRESLMTLDWAEADVPACIKIYKTASCC